MPREFPGFRDQLEDILSLSSGKSWNLCDKYLPVNKAGITAHVLTRKLVIL